MVIDIRARDSDGLDVGRREEGMRSCLRNQTLILKRCSGGYKGFQNLEGLPYEPEVGDILGSPKSYKHE